MMPHDIMLLPRTGLPRCQLMRRQPQLPGDAGPAQKRPDRTSKQSARHLSTPTNGCGRRLDAPRPLARSAAAAGRCPHCTHPPRALTPDPSPPRPWLAPSPAGPDRPQASWRRQVPSATRRRRRGAARCPTASCTTATPSRWGSGWTAARGACDRITTGAGTGHYVRPGALCKAGRPVHARLRRLAPHCPSGAVGITILRRASHSAAAPRPPAGPRPPAARRLPAPPSIASPATSLPPTASPPSRPPPASRFLPAWRLAQEALGGARL
jgi:hypothetical protein